MSGLATSQTVMGSVTLDAYCRASGAKMAEGFMLRYVYFIDRRWRKRLTVPEIPYSRIREVGAGMYKGVKR